MAKKKSGKKKAGKRYTGRKSAAAFSGAKERARAAKPASRGARSQPLPGMEQVRDRTLDNISEAIGDCRDQANQARTEEKSLKAAALKRMTDRNIQAYKHARVAMVVEPGAARLRVRMVKEEGDAEVAGGETTTAGEAIEERGDGGFSSGESAGEIH